MKKILHSGWFLLALGILVSCGDNANKSLPEDTVREYGKYFVEKLAANQLDSLKATFPDIINADSLISLQSDTVIVSESSPGIFEVILNPDVSLTVSLSEDGDIRVTDSYGLYKFDAEKMDLAKKTGMWNQSISDVKLNERLKDEGFINYLSKNRSVKNSDIISIGKMQDHSPDVEGYETLKQPLTNLTDQPIDGGDYDLVVKYYFPADPFRGVEFSEGKKLIEGINIPARDKAYFEGEIRAGQEYRVVDIEWKLSPEELQEKFAPYTGSEYQEYLNSKK